MFVCQGAALLILQYPGGEVSYDFATRLRRRRDPGILPAPIVVVAVALLVWFFLATRGSASRSTRSAATRRRPPTIASTCRFTRFMSFTLGGMFFGAAGLFITANTGSGDPLIGATMLLKVFAAVVLGGTLIGGGRGGALGTVFGALTLTIIVNIFLVLGVRTFDVPIVEGIVLILAVLGFTGLRESSGRRMPHVPARPRRRRRPESLRAGSPPLLPAGGASADVAGLARRATRRRSAIVLPAYILLVGGDDRDGGGQLAVASPSAATSSTLLVFGAFLAILGLGQGAVIIAGGLDLSVAWTITFPAIVVTTFANGSDAAGDLGDPARARPRRADRPRQRHARRRLPPVADHRDAGRRQRARGRRPRLPRRRADRRGAAVARRLRQRPRPRPAAGRLVPLRLRRRRDAAPQPQRASAGG